MIARLKTLRPVNLYWLCAILLTLVAVGCGGTSSDGNSNGSSSSGYGSTYLSYARH